MNVLGIIPARGGSKGVKNKNIREIAGEPLINYTIRSAFDSTKLDEIIISTDSDKIKAVAERPGVRVIKRPKELALDHSPVVPTLLHALDYSENLLKVKYELIVLLQPTSPIRTGLDIDNVIGMFEHQSSLEAVISVVPMEEVHPARMYRLDGEGWMKSLWGNSEEAQRQSLAPIYYRNGCIYAIRSDVLRSKKSLMVSRKKAYVMPLKYLANIDDERDFITTEVLLDLWKQGKL